ncbi:hypothetical protein Daesc_010600 [Daldinia eschscholtzii]|uniref:Uncharacterized protein n=1 Tax=Daldinia eschscholtzii TaxID=292717 RepID=A0AAX6M847_9PEZI
MSKPSESREDSGRGNGQVPFIQLDLPRTVDARKARVQNQTRKLTKAPPGRAVDDHQSNKVVVSKDLQLPHSHSTGSTFLGGQKPKAKIGTVTSGFGILTPGWDGMSSSNQAVHAGQAAS